MHITYTYRSTVTQRRCSAAWRRGKAAERRLRWGPQKHTNKKHAQVYNDSEALFSRLADEAKRLKDWAALAAAEGAAGGGLEALVEGQCQEVADFEANLKGLKVRRVQG